MDASLGDHLAAAFGGGPDRSEAYQEGRYNRARTEDALARARLNRDTAMARSRLQGQDFGEVNPMDILLGELGSDYAGTHLGRLRGQEYGFREDIANPDTPMASRQYAAQAVAGRPESFLQSMGQGQYTDIRDEAPDVQSTPLGDAITEAYVALKGQRDRSPSAGGSEPLVRTIDEQGNPVYTPRSDAAGMTPAPSSSGMSLNDFAVRERIRALAKVMSDPYANPEEKDAAAAEIDALTAGEAGPEEGGIPEGSRLIGHTAAGAEVYETPDGRRLVAD